MISTNQRTLWAICLVLSLAPRYIHSFLLHSSCKKLVFFMVCFVMIQPVSNPRSFVFINAWVGKSVSCGYGSKVSQVDWDKEGVVDKSVSSEQDFRQMCSQIFTTSLVQSVMALLNSEDLDGADSSIGRLFLHCLQSILKYSWGSIRAEPCPWIYVADAPMRLCLRLLFHFTATFQMRLFVPHCGPATAFFCIWWRHPVRRCSVRLSYCFARSHLIVFGFE